MIPESILAAVAAFAAGWFAARFAHRRAEDPFAPVMPPGPELSAPEPRALLYGLRDQFRQPYEGISRPDDLLDHPGFEAIVGVLRDGPFEEGELVQYYDGGCPIIAAAAIVAIGASSPSEATLADVLREIHDVDFFSRHLALRVLRDQAPERAVIPLLEHLDRSWDAGWGRRVLRDHLAACFASDGPPDISAAAKAALRNETYTVAWFTILLADLGEVGDAITARLVEAEPPAAAEQPATPRATEADDAPPASGLPLLQSFARVLTPSTLGDPPLVDARVQAQADAILHAIDAPRRRSVVLVGEAGAGKSAAIRAAITARIGSDAVVFEAGAVDLLAGQKYIGMFEQRLHGLVETFRQLGRRALWICPAFHELAWAGRHDNSPSSALDFLLPYIEEGTVTVIGEVQPAEWERLQQTRPSVRTALEVVATSAPTEAEALDLARAWLGRRDATLTSADLREALRLAQQHLDDLALPGGLIHLLDHALQARPDDSSALRRDELLAAVGTLTGLPRDVLDDDARLDDEDLRAFFTARVMGQPEAVDCLVDRVAMIKAGLTDPTRPQGVFLFTGSTGTGKTEIAKALATWLFGSPERIVRLDMSELQDDGAMSRILGESGAHDESQALVHRIRQQPFSVVLLDEFEKAHPAIWDLFLQIFDEGRLSDRKGRRADFRHAIVIATSNVGAEQAQGASLGFGAAREQAVADQLRRTFRLEFLNRIDRIITFRPLSEATMRRVLEKELWLAIERRGLRSRQWAVEWDQTALDFLLRAGFSPELGARPLRRAIERHFLAPLARTIAGQRAPAGDQFLFVRSDGQRIQVQFADPDGPDEPQAQLDRAPPETLHTAAIALDGGGTPAEFAVLEQRYAELAAHAESEPWIARKTEALDATSDPDFWTSPDRFAVLGTAEYIDRIRSGLRTAGRLLGRLRGGRKPRKRYDATLVRRLAEHLNLLDRAIRDVEEGAPTEAFLQVEALPDAQGAEATSAFGARVAAMYEAWASKRGMTWSVLERVAPSDGHAARVTLAVAGYGAWSILAPEHGLHVLAVESDRPHSTARHRVRVTVAPQPAEPPKPETPAGHLAQARASLSAREVEPDIVRRYREQPSPLVRDRVRGWRTGRLDRVLDGDFDLIR